MLVMGRILSGAHHGWKVYETLTSCAACRSSPLGTLPGAAITIENNLQIIQKMIKIELQTLLLMMMINNLEGK